LDEVGVGEGEGDAVGDGVLDAVADGVADLVGDRDDVVVAIAVGDTVTVAE
jgi:hypothetical protein